MPSKIKFWIWYDIKISKVEFSLTFIKIKDLDLMHISVATSNCLEEKRMRIILPFKIKIELHDKWNPQHVQLKSLLDDVHLYILIRWKYWYWWHPHVLGKELGLLLSQEGNFQIFTCLTSFKIRCPSINILNQFRLFYVVFILKVIFNELHWYVQACW